MKLFNCKNNAFYDLDVNRIISSKYVLERNWLFFCCWSKKQLFLCFRNNVQFLKFQEHEKLESYRIVGSCSCNQ